MNEFKVGLLALVSIVAVVIMSLKITSNQSGFGEYIEYRSIISDAAGIFPKTPIKVAGINAGRIISIELQGNQALITYEIQKSILIPEDSRLKIKTIGFLGDKYIEIVLGTSEKRLAKGHFIPSEENGGIDQIMKGGQDILADVRVITSALRKTFSGENGENKLEQILSSVEITAKNAKEIAETLNRVLSENEEQLNQIVTNIESFTHKIDDQLDPEKKDTILADLKSVTADVKALTADIRRGKGTLGKLLVEEDIADQVKETLAGVKKIVVKVDNIRTELALFTGADTRQGGVTDANLKIFPSPERFYLVGVTTSKIGLEKKREVEKNINGVTTYESYKERERDTFRFNVMIGRQISNWSFRAGLIESTGGLGVDYEFKRIGTKLFAEIFDVRKDIGPNLRFGADIHTWNVFYGRLATEDILTDFRSLNISVGLRFNDEDLKGLIGFLI